MATILIKPLAQADLLDIWNFIASDSFDKAKLETFLAIAHP
ncbi:MAG: hypothetical protein V7K67_23850 [Nostoc sp.]